MTKNLDYHEIIIDILKEFEFHTYQPRQQRAYRVVIKNLHHSMQQKIVTEEIESMEHKIRNLWNLRRRVTGCHLSLFFLDIEPAANSREMYIEYPQNMRELDLTKSKIIYWDGKLTISAIYCLPPQTPLKSNSTMPL
jgi:hypothetical protein